MFACILILNLILFLPAALLPCTLGTFFSSRDLNEMGIDLYDSESTPLPGASVRRML
jgi:hypothetical protein